MCAKVQNLKLNRNKMTTGPELDTHKSNKIYIQYQGLMKKYWGNLNISRTPSEGGLSSINVIVPWIWTCLKMFSQSKHYTLPT